MLSWFFKKRGGVDAAKAAASRPAVDAPAKPSERRVENKPKPAVDGAAWQAQLQSAQGNDAALLGIVQSAAPPEVRVAAVEALAAEDALRQAERELRGHDRRVHRAAKRRLETAVARREARARAQALLASASALAGVTPVPANRLVSLDRDWQSLDAALLDPAQVSEFDALRDRLNAAVREQGERQQQLQRWSADAQRALAALRLACTRAAADGSADDLAASRQAAQALHESSPYVPAAAELGGALQAALHTAAQVEARLTWLDARGHSAGVACETDGVREPVRPEDWQALAPLADVELARMLDQRFAQWLHAHAPAAPMPTEAAPPPAAPKGPDADHLRSLDALLGQAEAALAEGQLGAMQQHLQAIDAALAPMHGEMPGDRRRARHQALLAEHARLKGWQQWGGGRARDDLMAEAEELARLTLAATTPPSTDAPAAPKLRLKDHAEAIHTLRHRWKELDRLGAPAHQALWQRFDAALHTAHQPVATQQAALKAARQDNLSAREALLAELEALPDPAGSTEEGASAVPWKEHVRALERFHTAWRQLGPIEHTVPAAARAALQQRVRETVERVEAPLQEARRAAAAVREQLIVRAEALVEELREHPQMRDAVPRLRDLQAEWQQHAQTLPLARAVESALWARFRAASDALFAQREAAFGARDAEIAANLAAREGLLERLEALNGDGAADELGRTLAEVERAWRQPVDLPRGAAGALDARFRDVRAAAQQRLNDSVQQRWRAECDTLAAKLALCEEREER
ncbi:partial putative protein, partial [Burkholderiaceae bacterium]